MKKFIYTVFTLCFTLTITAQVSFQRLYDVVQDSTHILTDGIATRDGGFATLGNNVVVENNAGIIHRAIFTTYDSKGEIQLAKDIYLADSTRLLSTSELTQVDNGSFVISANLDEMDLSNCVVALDAITAEPIWSRRVADETQLKISLSSMPGNEVVAGSTNVQEGISIWLSRINAITGTDVWAKEYIALDEDSNDAPADLFDLHVSTIDSSIIMTGQSVVGGTTLGYHTTKVDRNGEVIWSRHVESAPEGLNFQPLGVTEATDTSVYVTGRIAFNDGVTLINSLFVTKYDKLGKVLWVKELTGANNTFHNGNDIVALGNNLVISTLGTETGLETESGMIEIDTAGVVLNSQVYRDTMTFFGLAGGLSTTIDGGLALFTTRFEQPLELVSDIVKTGADLTTPCSSPGSGTLEDVPFRSLSLGWIVTDFEDSDTLETDISNVNYYDVPKISPSPDQWCPNEQIIDTLDATPSPLPDGEITYEWMGPGVDGAMTSSVVGMEEGEYMVTVTINDKHCYTLCDTVNISRLSEPTAAIGIDESQYCNEGTISLIAQFTGVPDIQDFIWNTEETTTSITTDVAGTFSYSFTDGCGETAFAEAIVTLPILDLSVSTFVDYGADCSDSTATLTATVSPSDLQNIVIYEWKNNTVSSDIISTNNPFIVATDGDYTVEVKYCNESDDSNITVNIPIIGDLQWPKVFFPRGEEEVNRTFGPYNACDRTISNYTLKIYNRWGNEVFTSDNIDSEWNGQHGGSDSASAVYVWVAEYTINGDDEPKIDKGDVTLLR